MAITLTELIQRATDIATSGVDPNLSPALDAEGLAESHLKTVFSSLASKYAREGKTHNLAKKTKTLSFTDGEATLTDDVLVSCLDSSSLRDLADLTKLYAWRPHLDDALDDYERRLGYYFMLDSQTIGIIEPDEEYDSDSGLTDDRRLSASCVWDIPTDVDDEISVSEEVAGDMITMMAESLRGEIAKREVVVA